MDDTEKALKALGLNGYSQHGYHAGKDPRYNPSARRRSSNPFDGSGLFGAPEQSSLFELIFLLGG
jgi:hypothetical protein